MKTISRTLFIILSFLLLSRHTTAHAAVWTATNSWNEQWETTYRQWVAENLKSTFFSETHNAQGDPNPFFGLRPDCADTVYTMRVAFAWLHSLPVAFSDPTAGTRLITNEMKRWDRKADEAERVRSFIRYLYDILSTHSLPNDTYPTAISSVRSGTIIMTTRKNHHSWTIKQISEQGIPWLVYNSTVGTTGDLVIFERKSWPNANWVFEDNFSPSGNAGFRYWRPAQYLNSPVETVPGYSEEQYQIPLAEWTQTVQSRLARSQESAKQKLERYLTASCQTFGERVEFVNRAREEQVRQGDLCWNYTVYDIHSTPNRDRNWMITLLSLRKAYAKWMTSSEYQPADPLARQLQKIFPNLSLDTESENRQMPVSEINDDSICITEYLPGQTMDLAEAKRRLFAGLISNNPLDNPEVRWGSRLRRSDEQAARCESWDPYTPNFNEALE